MLEDGKLQVWLSVRAKHAALAMANADAFALHGWLCRW